MIPSVHTHVSVCARVSMFLFGGVRALFGA